MPTEKAFRKVSGPSGLMGVVIIAIIDGNVLIVIVSFEMTTSFVVSAIDDSTCRGSRGEIGDRGSSKIWIMYFTVGSWAVPIARGHPGARWRTDTIVVYLVSY